MRRRVHTDYPPSWLLSSFLIVSTLQCCKNVFLSFSAHFQNQWFSYCPSQVTVNFDLNRWNWKIDFRSVSVSLRYNDEYIESCCTLWLSTWYLQRLCSLSLFLDVFFPVSAYLSLLLCLSLSRDRFRSSNSINEHQQIILTNILYILSKFHI